MAKTGTVEAFNIDADSAVGANRSLRRAAERQLRELEDAFNLNQAGADRRSQLSPRQLRHGKTAVARHFLDSLRRVFTRGVFILEGRCYETRSGSLQGAGRSGRQSHEIFAEFAEAKAEALMPREVLALAALVPVMLQAIPFLMRRKTKQEIPDPFALRRKHLRPCVNCWAGFLTGSRWCSTSTICNGLR